MKTNNVIIKQSCIRVWASCLSPYVFNYISCHFQSWLAASVNKHDASSGQSVLKRCNIFPALPCRHLITGRSKCVLMWVCVFLRPHFTPINTFQVQEEVLPPTPTADHQSRSIKVAVSQLTALCRKRIRVSGGGYSNYGRAAKPHIWSNRFWGRSSHLLYSSVAWVSHSTETNTHTCSHTPAISLHMRNWERLLWERDKIRDSFDKEMR